MKPKFRILVSIVLLVALAFGIAQSTAFTAARENPLEAASLAGQPLPWGDPQLYWAQRVDGGGRTVLLRWHDPGTPPFQVYLPTVLRQYQDGQPIAAGVGVAATADYTIYRRDVGKTAWQPIGTTRPAGDAAEMSSRLGASLTDQLSWELRDDGQVDPLTQIELYQLLLSDAPRVRLLAEQLYEIGLVRGTAYLDTTAPTGKDLEYYIAHADSGQPRSVPIRIRADANPNAPTGLREVWPGPAELGQPASARPGDAEERYRWDYYQQYRAWDGTVSLIWDTPSADPVFDGEVVDTPDSVGIWGYHVYRTEPGTSNWELLNEHRKCPSFLDQSDCIMPVRASALPEGPGAPDAFFFREDLKTRFSDPSQAYASWDYKVCVVDWLRQETCSTPITAYGRDLDSPAIVTGLEVQEPEDGPIQLSWVYSDTAEVSAPLRFYVTRSPTLTLPITQWVPVVPEGSSDAYLTVPVTTATAISITDSPPKGVPHWYRVQVRDDAGNWSPASAPVLAAIYPRTPPPFAAIPYDALNCDENGMPLTLSALDPRVRVVAVYRSFAPSGPWQLIKRVPVTGGTAIIADDYVPPYPLYAYYRLEAIDGHGNVSPAQPYCALLDPGTAPPAPTVTSTLRYEGGWYEDIEIDRIGDYAQVVVTRPGVDGTSTTTETTTSSSHRVDLNGGEWAEITVYGLNGNGTGDGTTFWSHPTNNYLDTGRQMTDLGQPFDISWVTDTVPSPVVRINLTGQCDSPGCGASPYVAAFRRIPNGNWMQVTPVQPVAQEGPAQPWIITDTADLSANQAYEYVVLAFSRTRYEVLGYWGPTTLSPLTATPKAIDFSPGIATGPRWPKGCSSTNRQAPKLVGMPAQIQLHNGWAITVTDYWLGDGTMICPPASANPDFLSGSGTLSNGQDSWGLTFYGIAVYTDTGIHKGGRIVATLNHDVSGAGRFDIALGDIEFYADAATAEVTLTLPENIKVVDPVLGRSHRIFSQVTNVTTDFQFYPIARQDVYLVDENLPWQIHYHWARFWYDVIEQYSDFAAETIDRLQYPAPAIDIPAAPDNNLAFMRQVYTSSNPYVDPNGLQGSFSTSQPILYSTSLPAGVIVEAQGAQILIQDSHIQGGSLLNAQARMDYLDQDMIHDYVGKDIQCGNSAILSYAVCEGPFGVLSPATNYRALMLYPDAATILIGQGGTLSATVDLDQTVTWPQFEVYETRATLYVAAAAFADATTSWAPMPAENAWRRLPDPISGGDFDPGLNINAAGVDLWYQFYDPAVFTHVDVDLYVRRGGVSEYLLILPGSTGQLTNAYGYQETLIRLELLFQDNTVDPPEPVDYQADLYLPYPSDVVLPLRVTAMDPSSSMPKSGVMRLPTTALHQYWRFEEMPTTWQYLNGLSLYGIETLTKVLSLEGTAVINGLHQQSTVQAGAPVSRAVHSEWFPNGDVGDLYLTTPEMPADGYRASGFHFSLTGVQLSRYYSTLMDENSLPGVPTVDMSDNAIELPAALLDPAGNLTPQSLKDCSLIDVVGCGFVLLDGNVAVDYFGEIESTPPGAMAAQAGSDQPQGKFPIATSAIVTATVNLVTKGPQAQWIWPLADDAVDLGIPVKFLGNTEGGALVGVLRDASILPDPLPEILKADLAAVITVDWSSSRGYSDTLGIFAGYGASQAAFRALAMNRPLTETAGTRPFDEWDDVKEDVAEWAQLFGYTTGDQITDTVDLAETIWDKWCAEWTLDIGDPDRTCTQTLEFHAAYDVLAPTLRAMKGVDNYGVTGIEAGSVISSNVYFNTGLGQVVFLLTGNGMELDSFQFGSQFGIAADKKEDLITSDWVSLEYNRDGEFIFFAENLQVTLSGDTKVSSDFIFLVGTAEGYERVEGGITIRDIEISELASASIGGALGVGKYAGETIAYLGVKGEFDFQGQATVGGALLFGVLPHQSPALELAGYGDVLAKFDGEDIEGRPQTYAGFYLNVHGEWPIIDEGCSMRAKGGGSLSGWYFWAYDDQNNRQDIYGGQLSAHVYATAACVVSARGELSLTLEQLGPSGQISAPPGVPASWDPFNRTCQADECTAFSGSFWIAAGVGDCSPGSWDKWEERWWGDSWCYTVGAIVGLSYLDPAPGDAWDFDYYLDYEDL